MSYVAIGRSTMGDGSQNLIVVTECNSHLTYSRISSTICSMSSSDFIPSVFARCRRARWKPSSLRYFIYDRRASQMISLIGRPSRLANFSASLNKRRAIEIFTILFCVRAIASLSMSLQYNGFLSQLCVLSPSPPLIDEWVSSRAHLYVYY